MENTVDLCQTCVCHAVSPAFDWIWTCSIYALGVLDMHWTYTKAWSAYALKNALALDARKDGRQREQKDIAMPMSSVQILKLNTCRVRNTDNVLVALSIWVSICLIVAHVSFTACAVMGVYTISINVSVGCAVDLVINPATRRLVAWSCTSKKEMARSPLLSKHLH